MLALSLSASIEVQIVIRLFISVAREVNIFNSKQVQVGVVLPQQQGGERKLLEERRGGEEKELHIGCSIPGATGFCNVANS